MSLDKKEIWSIRKRVLRKQFSSPRLLIGHFLAWVSVCTGSIGFFIRLTELIGVKNHIDSFFPVKIYLSTLTPVFDLITFNLGIPEWSEIIRDVVAIYWSIAAASMRLSSAYYALSLTAAVRSLVETISWGYDDPDEENIFNIEERNKREEIRKIKRKIKIDGLLLISFFHIKDMWKLSKSPLSHIPDRAANGGDATASFAQAKYLAADGLVKLFAVPILVITLTSTNLFLGLLPYLVS